MKRAVGSALVGFERNFQFGARAGCYHARPNNISPRLSRQKSSWNDSDTTGSPSSEPKSRTPEPKDNKTKSTYPPRPETRPIRLVGRTKGLIKVAPDSAHIPIDTSLPSLVSSDGAPVVRSSAFRPPYLTEQLARHLSIHVNDPYVITRSVELFGSPWSAQWVANLTVGASREVIADRTSSFLRVLPWGHVGVRPLSDEAWAEHLVAMQNPRLRHGPDDYEPRAMEPVSNPPWPSDTPSPQNVGLSWSSSSERDVPRTPARRISLAFGKQTYPRPKRIDRLYAWDNHLIVVFASPAARRAVLAAYAWWMRRKLLDAYEEDEKPSQPAMLPPVSAQELRLGGVPVGSDEHSALHWAKQVGWRPEYRIRPYQGRRNKNDDGEGWYQTEVEIRLQIRNRRIKLRERLREEQDKRRRRKVEERRDVESEGQT